MTQTVIVGKLTKLPFDGHIIDGVEHKAFEVEAEIVINGKETGKKGLFMIQSENQIINPEFILGRLVGIKGHLDVGSYIGVDGIPSRMIYIIADKISFL